MAAIEIAIASAALTVRKVGSSHFPAGHSVFQPQPAAAAPPPLMSRCLTRTDQIDKLNDRIAVDHRFYFEQKAPTE
jgi:hypothetical protein